MRQLDGDLGPCVVCGKFTSDWCETVDRNGRTISVHWQHIDCEPDR